MENNPDRFSVIARSRKQVARPHASRARCDPPISARRSPSSRHLVPINAQLRLGVTYEKGVTLGNVTMSHRTRERPAECLASLSHSTMIGLPRAALEN
ncbi:hypothetical protein EVAR_60096_1 [Eumeta japonica]|uniref:Uncharacterized protein n=1 Tax=Eumeta variegata TaxID=151549 RepID=A0A4C2A4H1_EUMVA|nr:hypothetical protein EVAR_60096_1 [Eumeta japonica]